MSILKSLLTRWFPPKHKRIDLKIVTYRDAEALLKAGYTLAPEEDSNHAFGVVYLELLGSPEQPKHLIAGQWEPRTPGFKAKGV